MSTAGREVTAESRIDTTTEISQPDRQVGRHLMEAS